MLDIAQGSADRFKKLAYLSLPPTFHKSIHTELALCFRKTLKELVFMIGFGDESYQSELRSLQPLLNRLDKFESLASLSIELSGEIDSMDIFDDILNRCNHLLKVTIGIDNFRDSAWLGREEMREWMVRNVTKCSNACGLHITFMHNPQIVEYLLYKYPNANKVVLTGHGLEEREEEIIERCTHAATNFDNVTMSFTDGSNQSNSNRMILIKIILIKMVLIKAISCLVSFITRVKQ